MADDELAASTTEGYKVGDKKTLDEYKNLDAHDDSLNKWKASLGLSDETAADKSDPRTVIIEELALVVAGRPDITVDLTKPADLETLQKHPFTIKEGSEYQMRIKFKVQHEIINGLRYIHVVKRKGIKVDKTEEMLGSYGPNTPANPIYSKTLPLEEAPSGMLARGSYNAASLFTDDDKKEHLKFSWAFDIKKEW